MKSISVFIILLISVSISFGELYISDMSCEGEETRIIEGVPWLFYYVDTFTVSASSSADNDNFFLYLNRFSIDIYYSTSFDAPDISSQPDIRLHTFLDDYIRFDIEPEITIYNGKNSLIRYSDYYEGYQDLWYFDYHFWEPPVELVEPGPLFSFNYIPEPATLLLLGVGGLLIRKRK